MKDAAYRPRVAYQGAPGAFGEEAIARYWGGRAEPVGVSSFAAAVAAVRSGGVRYAVLPVWNSTIGRIRDAWAVLGDGEGKRCLAARAVGEITIPVRHCLMGRPGVRLADVTTVMGHPAALAQCERALATLGYQLLPAEDSAGAAGVLAAARDGTLLRVPGTDTLIDPRTAATLGPVGAAARYRLAVLACSIQDRKDNRTSFLVIDAGKSDASPQP